MTYIIGSPCIGVMETACVDVCPVDCIYWEPGIDQKLSINPDECIGCAACETACLDRAIFAIDDVPPHEEEFIELNRLYFLDREAVREQVERSKERQPAERTASVE